MSGSMANSLDRRPSGEVGDSSSWRRSNSQNRDTEVVENYQIGQVIGRGGFASVHKCLNVLTAEVVAAKKFEGVKISKSDISTVMVEADLLKGLQHPNVVRFIEVVKKKDTLYLFTEYVEGGSLTALIDEFGCVPESMCVVYVPQILAGLAYLHDRGIIHRDIKGSNILLTKGGQIKLTDFGVSAILNDVEKRFSVVGTPYWIAPEVIKLDGWKDVSDVWSLGCTIVELLQGAPPYFDLYPMAAMYKIVEEPMPVPEDGCSQELKDFLHACFAKPASTRPAASRLLGHPWVTKHATVQPTDFLGLRNELRQMTITIEAAEANKLAEKLNERAQAYAKQRKSAKGMNFVRTKNPNGQPGYAKPSTPTRPSDSAPPARPSPAPSPARERGGSVSQSTSTENLRARGNSVSQSASSDNLRLSSGTKDREKDREDSSSARERDREREREREKEKEKEKERSSEPKEHKEKDKSHKDKEMSRSKSRDVLSSDAKDDSKNDLKRQAASAKHIDYRRSLPPGSVSPLNSTAGQGSSQPSPVRRSTKSHIGSSGGSSASSDKDSSGSKSTSSRSDSTARERLAEQKADKYKVLADEAKADAARSRTKLEDTEKDMKSLKKALEEANQKVAQLTVENSSLQAKMRNGSGKIAVEAVPVPPPREPYAQAPKTFTPPAAEGPSRSDWGDTRDLNSSIQALQEQLKANEEKAKQLAAMSAAAGKR